MSSLRFFAFLALAVACALASPAEEAPRAKKQVLLGGAYPYSAGYVAPLAYSAAAYPAAYSAAAYPAAYSAYPAAYSAYSAGAYPYAAYRSAYVY